MDETLNDIVAEIRGEFVRIDLERLADRIEAAAKREREEWTSGNPGALRSALIQCELFLANVCNHGHPKLNPGDECVACKDCEDMRSMVCKALDAAPDRNEDRAPGNAAAMRRALEWVAEFVELGVDDEYGTDGQNLTIAAEKARAALSAPARNCDVGTAEEQAERFEAECKRHDHCTPCPVHREWGEFKEGKPKSCQMIWSQMPFVPAKGGRE